MNNKPELIVMLTHNDKTVKNAYEVFEECKESKAKFWGFKEEPLPFSDMKNLYQYMKQCGKKTFLEVVSYTDEEGLKGAHIAHECGCDILMGTIFSDEINDYCKSHNMKYMPFVGDVINRPSILKGSIDSIILEAKKYIEKGVYGFDLLGYRYEGNAYELNKKFIKEVNVPVCIAGSINSYKKLDEIKEINPWTFTIGGAFFENKFDGSIKEQIDKVCDYIRE